MKVLYFDCFSGISGDMALAALLDLGINESVLINELDKLKLSGYDLVISRKSKSGVFGTDVEVIIKDSLEDHHNLVMGHHHEPTEISTGHHKKTEHKHEHRTFKMIKEMIVESDLSIKVKKLSIDIFTEIAKAEAHVHNQSIEEVHFHEVGATDSIVDIVGFAICMEELGIERVYASALHDGTGFIKCQHGEIPIPVPAVMEMLKGTVIPLITEHVGTELVTPTGMAMIKTIGFDFGSMPAMLVERIGYGFGKRETGRFNALRVVMGSMFDEDFLYEEVVCLEANIDNMSSEIVGFTFEKLMDLGAFDVFITPIYMKKNRPAIKISVICSSEKEKTLLDCLFRETTTIGVRREKTSRYALRREKIELNTEYGPISFKLSGIGEMDNASPEYEDCRKIAKNHNIPLRKVYDIASQEIRQYLQKN